MYLNSSVPIAAVIDPAAKRREAKPGAQPATGRRGLNLVHGRENEEDAPQYLPGRDVSGGRLLLARVASRADREPVKRNALYGFRTPKTLASDEIWYPANRYAGRALFYAALAIIAGSLLLLPFAGRLSTDAVAFAGLALTLVPLGVAVAKSFRYLSRL
jgi:hypothetical protein